ncbi:fibulin-7-like isoform 2-T2 [Xenentodon cancila]
MTFEPVLPFLNPSRQPMCPYPPVPAHGTFYFYNVENPALQEPRQYIRYACYPGYTLAHGDVHRYCQQGGTWSGVTPVCLELTPCSVNNGGCSQLCSHSQMYNQSSNQTQTRVRCHCKPGFTLLDDGQTCRDIDECAVTLGRGPCMQRCHNSPGSYRCSCTYGHILAGDGHSCIAECPAGYRKQPTTPPESPTIQTLKQECLDINECLEETCEWQCVNLPGSHRCICPRGYTLQKDGQRCKDINECSRKNGGCSHLCVNRRGGYKCACPASHRLSAYSWKTCQPRTTANTAG